MNKINKSIVTLLLLSIVSHVHLYGESSTKKSNIIERQFRSIRADIGKVQKCFSKSRCDEQEHKEAQKALGRLSVKTAALVAAITLASVGIWKVRKLVKKTREKGVPISEEARTMLTQSGESVDQTQALSSIMRQYITSLNMYFDEWYLDGLCLTEMKNKLKQMNYDQDFIARNKDILPALDDWIDGKIKEFVVAKNLGMKNIGSIDINAHIHRLAKCYGLDSQQQNEIGKHLENIPSKKVMLSEPISKQARAILIQSGESTPSSDKTELVDFIMRQSLSTLERLFVIWYEDGLCLTDMKNELQDRNYTLDFIAKNKAILPGLDNWMVTKIKEFVVDHNLGMKDIGSINVDDHIQQLANCYGLDNQQLNEIGQHLKNIASKKGMLPELKKIDYTKEFSAVMRKMDTKKKGVTQSFGKFYTAYWTPRLPKLKSRAEGGHREDVEEKIKNIKNIRSIDAVKLIIQGEFNMLKDLGKKSYLAALSKWIDGMSIDHPKISLSEIEELLYQKKNLQFADFYIPYWNSSRLDKLTSKGGSMIINYLKEVSEYGSSEYKLMFEAIKEGYYGLPESSDKIEYLKAVVDWLNRQS